MMYPNKRSTMTVHIEDALEKSAETQEIRVESCKYRGSLCQPMDTIQYNSTLDILIIFV